MLSSAYLRLKLHKSRKCILAVLLLLLAFILTNGSFENSHCSCEISEEPSALSPNNVKSEQHSESVWKDSKTQPRVQNVVRKRRRVSELYVRPNVPARAEVLNDGSPVHVYQPEKSNTAKESTILKMNQPSNPTEMQQPNVGLFQDGSYARVSQRQSNRPFEWQQLSQRILPYRLEGKGRTGANLDSSLFPQHSDGTGIYNTHISGNPADGGNPYIHPTNKPTENCYCPYPLRAKNKLCYHMVTCFPRTTSTMSTTSSTTDSTTTDSTTTDSTTTDSTTTDSTTTDSTTTDSTTTDSTTTDSTTTTTDTTTTNTTTTETTTTTTTTPTTTTTTTTTTPTTTTTTTTPTTTTTRPTTTSTTERTRPTMPTTTERTRPTMPTTTERTRPAPPTTPTTTTTRRPRVPDRR
ncbi:transcription initiation factor TFIID subunit 12-like [Anopheles maculipalpis]|uniref:transcription initiation factor TFIID subunit 12-like n=1 Tax=Anopheles maculipalpis TaxID=1496333 RepID=UPI002159485F|nr:transcription initiation factor TFIID subunit 12-like [Anopheles maculipalpis]